MNDLTFITSEIMLRLRTSTYLELAKLSCIRRIDQLQMQIEIIFIEFKIYDAPFNGRVTVLRFLLLNLRLTNSFYTKKGGLAIKAIAFLQPSRAEVP